MLELLKRKLVFEDFADKIGGIFSIAEFGMPEVAFVLKQAVPLNPALAFPGIRPPFSLMFLVKQQTVLPQRMYRLRNDHLGEMVIFLVPVGRSAEGVSYQAVFN